MEMSRTESNAVRCLSTLRFRVAEERCWSHYTGHGITVSCSAMFITVTDLSRRYTRYAEELRNFTSYACSLTLSTFRSEIILYDRKHAFRAYENTIIPDPLRCVHALESLHVHALRLERFRSTWLSFWQLLHRWIESFASSLLPLNRTFNRTSKSRATPFRLFVTPRRSLFRFFDDLFRSGEVDAVTGGLRAGQFKY